MEATRHMGTLGQHDKNCKFNFQMACKRGIELSHSAMISRD